MKALIFGVAGQSGSYLADFLLEKDYSVVGVVRRCSNPNYSNIQHLFKNPRFTLEEGDVTDPHSVSYVLNKYCFDEIYNLAAQSHVGSSFTQPKFTFDVTFGGCLNILEAIRHSEENCFARFYQASSSEMFGNCHYDDGSQDENTPMLPCSPYAVAKLAAHNLVKVYRKSYCMFACGGILFNHESPRRGINFVTRKITKWIGDNLEKIHNGRAVEKLKLGNITTYRDWGYAGDYVEAMWKMLQQKEPKDFVIATGEAHSVNEFLTKAFNCVNLYWGDWVEIDPNLYRPCELMTLKGNASYAKRFLNWAPKVSFDELVELMVNYDTGNIGVQSSTR